MDEQEKIDKRAHVRLIVTEILMFLSVLFLVGLLTLIVMGYSFNLQEIGGSGEVVERSGLVQVSSLPTGATILIDGEAPLLLTTNASRTMLAGEHEIMLEKDGFDSWNKKINVVEGIMYRLNYPRLFRKEREAEMVFWFKFGEVDFAKMPEKYMMGDEIKSGGVKFATVSPNHEKMVILIESNLYMMNLNESKPELKLIGVVDASEKMIAVNSMRQVEWSGNSERVLAQVNGEWVVINVKNPKETVWLESIMSSEVSAGEKRDGIAVKEVKFESEAGEKLLVLGSNEALYELNIRDKRISEALVEKVKSFDNDSDRVVLLNDEDELKAYRVGDQDSYLIAEMESGAKFATMRYFQESYVGVMTNGEFEIYRKIGWASGDEDMERIFCDEVQFEVAEVKKRGKGMVFELAGDSNDAVFDIEAMKLISVNASNAGWVDEYLRYRLQDGKLTVVDYDGANERELVKSGVVDGRTVTISGNNKWLYYFAKDESGVEKLVREKIL